MSTANYDPTKDNNPVKTFKPSVNIPFLDNSNVNKKKYAKDIKTAPVSSNTALKKIAGLNGLADVVVRRRMKH